MGDQCRGPGHGPALDRAGIRRRRIIDAARMLFIANGFHATGVAEIARRSGVAVGQIYRDFAAKEDIVTAIVESDCAILVAREALRHAIRTDDSAAAWDWICHVIRPNDLTDARAMFAEIIAESTRNERIAAIMTGTHQGLMAGMRDALALLAPGDHLAERRDIFADVILSQSLGLQQYRFLRPGADTAALGKAAIDAVARELSRLRGQ